MMDNGRLYVWWTYYPVDGPSAMGLTLADEFVPIYRNIARDTSYRVVHGYPRDAFKVFERSSGRLVMDAETL